MARKKKRDVPEINASSMADIAFLLLIFFLVTTTMDIDRGIMVTLPPYSEEPPPDSQVNQRNVLEILVNAADKLLVEGEPMDVSGLKEMTIKHVDNQGRNEKFAESSEKAIVSLKNDKGTSYRKYIEVYNEIKSAYNELRNNMAQAKYNLPYAEITKEEQRIIRAKYPMKLSEAEPEDFAAKN